MDISEKLQGILVTLPAKPGCYSYHNAEGMIIYVGKAISLKNRVRSYFHSDSSHDAKTHLIKKHRPKYNIRLKDVCLFYGL